MTQNYKYDVFISYRTSAHPDSDVGEALQKILESFPIPYSLKKNIVSPACFRSRLKVFRDLTDLPATIDLDETIQEKLKTSRFLIIVCTLNTPKSLYCTEEIRQFRNYHGDNCVLALLAEGDPSQSFPTSLTAPLIQSDAKDIVIEIRTNEPLAADIRAGTVKEILRNLQGYKIPKSKQALFKLLSPILGLNSPDDLVKRHLKSIYRFYSLVIAIIVAFIVLITQIASHITVTPSTETILNPLKEEMYSEAFVASSCGLVKGSDDGQIYLISESLDTYESLPHLQLGTVMDLALIDSRNNIVSVSLESDFAVCWSLSKRCELWRFVNPNSVNWISVETMQDVVALGDDLGNVFLLDNNGLQINKITPPTVESGRVSDLVFSENRKSLIIAYEDFGVGIWDLGKETVTILDTSGLERIYSVTESNDNIFVGGQLPKRADNALLFVDKEGKPPIILDIERGTLSKLLRVSGKSLFFQSSWSGPILLWDSKSREVIWRHGVDVKRTGISAEQYCITFDLRKESLWIYTPSYIQKFELSRKTLFGLPYLP